MRVTVDYFGVIRGRCDECSRNTVTGCVRQEECIAAIKSAEILVMREDGRQIVAKLMDVDTIYDSVNGKDIPVHIDGALVFEKGHICPLFMNEKFKLKPLSMEGNGKLYRAIWELTYEQFEGADMLNEALVKRWNDLTGASLPCGKIKRVIVFNKY